MISHEIYYSLTSIAVLDKQYENRKYIRKIH